MPQQEQQKEKILLHACCAVCMAYPIKILEEQFSPIVYFCNPNIFPEKEYTRRKNELIKYCKQKNYKYIIENYEPKNWYNCISGLENEPEKGQRCNKCFEYRLKQTAQKAKEIGIQNFTTTLTVSPHKISKNIFEIGKKISQIFELNFIEYDFKKQNGFLKTIELAKKNEFYRQNYCGCEFSIRN